MASLWRAYSRLVDKFPWGSQILQTGVLCASGDVIAQVGRWSEVTVYSCCLRSLLREREETLNQPGSVDSSSSGHV